MENSTTYGYKNHDVPSVIVERCCAQFAVSRAQVLRRAKEEYTTYYQWLIETPLVDYISGRVFEYLWHVIFGCPES
ncbi:hypothetical protein K504DRAFT_533098 [Pleomassaria siparia CBS 279.74]|uniref:Uncharacterized protein n=1 Tax=Pleomassaria siparia CBS 279.74 TaxID=1314801 RepID=A0A6G1KB54_9PLEO|nr:hypothetical protein K504DRAFT_533098 [Pleomassaria siparia CBS 279.74]